LRFFGGMFFPKRRRGPAFALGLIIALGMSPGTAASVETSPADGLMGFYVYNFLLFVDPPATGPHEQPTLVICLLGKGDNMGFLDGIEGKQIRGKPIVLRRINAMDEMRTDCDVLFIRGMEKTTAHDMLSQLKSKPRLTMSDIPGFAEIGGMVEFLPICSLESAMTEVITAPPVVRFRINLGAVLDAGFRIRSRLLRLSEIVGGIPHGTSAGR
jgi:hypothetical protein